jgi:preprotein translocase subunit SecB
MAEIQPDAAQAPVAAAFSIEKIYLKDLSLENPGSPQSFMQQEAPQIEVGLRTSGNQIDPDVYECVVTITLTAKVGDKTLFLVEASQAGIFTIKGVPPDQIQGVIAVNCPNVIFPYIRETVADAVTRAGFPPVPSRADQFRRALCAAARANVPPVGVAAN